MKIKVLLALTVVATAMNVTAAEDYSANFAPLNSGFSPPPEAKGVPGRNVMPTDALPAIKEPADAPKPVPKPTPKPKPKPKPKAAPKPPKAPNPYDIPDSAMSLIPEIKAGFTLPKLGMPKQQSPKVLGQNVITVGSGRNEVVYASFRQPNRISTPFEKPKVIDVSGTEFQIVGQDIYFVPSKEEPIGIFIGGDNAPGRVASITLIPANIPGQNISLVFETKREMTEAQTLVGSDSSHIEYVRAILAAAINGDVPDGFDVSTTEVGMARIGNVLVTPKKLMSSRESNLFIYAVKNVGPTRQDLTEQSFYEDGVRGVTFWPKVALESGEESFVFILADKTE